MTLLHTRSPGCRVSLSKKKCPQSFTSSKTCPSICIHRHQLSPSRSPHMTPRLSRPPSADQSHKGAPDSRIFCVKKINKIKSETKAASLTGEDRSLCVLAAGDVPYILRVCQPWLQYVHSPLVSSGRGMNLRFLFGAEARWVKPAVSV